MSAPLPITPATRVGELLDAYPELEGQGLRTAVVRSGDGFATFVGRSP